MRGSGWISRIAWAAGRATPLVAAFDVGGLNSYRVVSSAASLRFPTPLPLPGAGSICGAAPTVPATCGCCGRRAVWPFAVLPCKGSRAGFFPRNDTRSCAGSSQTGWRSVRRGMDTPQSFTDVRLPTDCVLGSVSESCVSAHIPSFVSALSREYPIDGDCA
jgi:hypothetical protein